MRIANIGRFDPSQPAVIDGENALVLTHADVYLSGPSHCQIFNLHFQGVGWNLIGNLRATLRALRYIWVSHEHR